MFTRWDWFESSNIVMPWVLTLFGRKLSLTVALGETPTGTFLAPGAGSKLTRDGRSVSEGGGGSFATVKDQVTLPPAKVAVPSLVPPSLPPSDALTPFLPPSTTAVYLAPASRLPRGFSLAVLLVRL